MNSNTEVSDDHIIQIIPAPDHTTSQSHEQTPIATSTNSPTPKHESRGVNEMTPEELNSLKEDLRIHMQQDEWLESKSIIDKCPDMVRIPLNAQGDTALYLAVDRNNFEIVCELVNRMRPEDMLIPNSYGYTALHLAARKGSLKIVKELVNRMSPKDMLIKNSYGNTALYLAVDRNNFEIVCELVIRMRPEDRIIPNSDGDTALHLAASKGSLDIVKWLVTQMSPEDMLIKNSYGNTALYLAVEGNNFETVCELVNNMRPEDMLIPNSYGYTALHIAARKGSLKIVKELVNRMSPKDMVIKNSYGNTALYLAVDRNNFEIVCELVIRMRPEDRIIPNSDGDTALHLAASKGSLDIVKWLVTQMSPENMLIIKNSYGNTALHLAVERNSFDIVKELVNHMSLEDMLIPNSDGDTALHLAASKDSVEIVRCLVICTSSEGMVRKNSYGNTALHLAVERNSFKNVCELVFYMSPENMLIKNSYGNTALHLAASKGSLDIVKRLVINENMLIIKNSYGNIALHLAVERNNFEIVRELVNHMRPEEMLIPNSDGMLPVHLAAHDSNRIVDILSSQEVLDKMDFKDIERLFSITIRFDMFDSARRLFEKNPTDLAIARNEEDVTAVKMLGEKPRRMSDVCDWLLKEVSTLVETLEKNREDAIKSVNVEDVKMLIDKNPRLVTYRDHRNGWNLLHLVVLFRQKRIFNIIPQGLKEQSVQAVDYGGNNILHLVARLPQGEFEELSSLRASIQMQRELAWFKLVERNVSDELRTMRNNAGMRPINVFYKEHKKLSEEIKETAKGIAESGMLVSTLVATVAFAAALTVPGAKTNAWFTVFILTNAVALFTSFASLLSFLSNFTSSRFAESEFVKSLHPSLTFGRALLIIALWLSLQPPF